MPATSCGNTVIAKRRRQLMHGEEAEYPAVGSSPKGKLRRMKT
jgi:hypothetical protein